MPSAIKILLFVYSFIFLRWKSYRYKNILLKSSNNIFAIPSGHGIEAPSALSCSLHRLFVKLVFQNVLEGKPFNKGERKNEVYEIITSRIIEKLEAGIIPWHKPWQSVEGMPKNLISKKSIGNKYFMLAVQIWKPYWLSFKQAQELGGNVKKGERARPLFFGTGLMKLMMK